MEPVFNDRTPGHGAISWSWTLDTAGSGRFQAQRPVRIFWWGGFCWWVGRCLLGFPLFFFWGGGKCWYFLLFFFLSPIWEHSFRRIFLLTKPFFVFLSKSFHEHGEIKEEYRRVLFSCPKCWNLKFMATPNPSKRKRRWRGLGTQIARAKLGADHPDTLRSVLHFGAMLQAG